MLDIAINWLQSLIGRVIYSMARRWGPDSYDCSSAIYYSLIKAGKLPANVAIGNTDSLFRDLERNGWSRVPEDARGYIDTKRGDVFIWGVRGASSGAFGHTGMFVDANNIVHCSSGYNGMHVDNHDWLYSLNGSPANTIYRFTGAQAPTVPAEVGNPHDQSIDVGSLVKFTGRYTVNDVQLIGGIWQIKSDILAPKDFTWDENGIPAEPVYEVDADGYATPDQNLDPGASFVIPGRYKILDYGLTNGVWWGLIEWNGLKFWIDLAQATEIPSSDNGTPVPTPRPALQPPTLPAPEPPKQPEPPVQPEVPKPPEPAPEVLAPQPEPPKVETPPAPQPPVNQPNESKEKEGDMAFSKKQQEELMVASKTAQDFAAEVAASDMAKQLVSGISDKVKLAVYIVGDSLLGAAAITPQVIVLLNTHDPFIVATTLSSAFATAGLFLLTMFGIYKNGKKN